MTAEKYKKAQDAWVEMVNLKVGDEVEICRDASYHEYGWPNSWEPEMDEFIETSGKVKSIDYNGIFIGSWGYPFFVLEKTKKKLPDNIKISDQYAVEFKEDKSIRVGCQSIPFELLEKIYNTAKGI